MKFNKEVYDEILSKGLCRGMSSNRRVCIEAAIALASGEPLNDQPDCVHKELINLGIKLNDTIWSSPDARAKGLYKLGLAQLGTKDNPHVNKLEEHVVSKIIVNDFVPACKKAMEERRIAVEQYKLDEVKDVESLAQFIRLCRKCELHIPGLFEAYNQLDHYDYLGTIHNIRYMEDTKFYKDIELTYIVDRVLECLEEIGHSNEFDSIWKKEKKDEV